MPTVRGELGIGLVVGTPIYQPFYSQSLRNSVAWKGRLGIRAILPAPFTHILTLEGQVLVQTTRTMKTKTIYLL